MKTCVSVLLSLIASAALAAPAFQFGEPFPLTNTRYARVDPQVTLTSNGRDLFAVWADQGGTKIAKLGVTDMVLSEPVLSGGTPVVVWTGEHFLVAAGDRVRLLDREGVPVGAEFVAVPNGSAAAIATNGRNVMVIGTDGPQVRAYVLSMQGAAADPSGQLIDAASIWTAAIASNGTRYASIHTDTNGNRITITTFDENGAPRTQQSISSSAPRTAVIASDGTDYLAMWTNGDLNASDGSLRAIRIQSDGTLSAPFVIATPPAGAAAMIPGSLVWTGSSYALSMAEGALGQLMHAQFAFVGPQGILGAPTTLDGISYQRPSLAIANGHLLLAWGTSEGTRLRDLTARDEDRLVANFAANGQRLFRTVAGNDSTLLLWLEGNEEWHMGVRGRDGSWNERALPYTVSKRIATDGHGFVVADWKGYTGTASYYEADGTPRWTNVAIPFSIDDIVWSGRDFVITGSGPSRILMGVRLSASGSLSTPVPIPIDGHVAAGKSQLATDGQRILLVYAAEISCFQPCGSFVFLGGIVLDRDLNATSPPFEISMFSGYLETHTITWDGTQYILVYGVHTTGLAILAKRISREGVVDAQTIEITKETNRGFSVTPTTFGTVILWTAIRDGQVIDDAQVMASNGNVSHFRTFAHGSFKPLLVTLPDGKLGYFGVRSPGEEPYFGSSRVVMSIGDIISPARIPDPPKIAVTLASDQRLRVQWTTPQQPVTGYRIEYKIGKQDWLELESWFRPNDNTLFLTPVGNPASYSFRVRAWSDSGTSAYSSPASLSAKRRSTR